MVLVDEAELQVRAILDDAAKNPAAVGAGAQQMGDLYASFMDRPRSSAPAPRRSKPYFAKIDAANDKTKLQVLFATRRLCVAGRDRPASRTPAIRPNTSSPPARAGWAWAGANITCDAGAKYDAFRTAYRAYVEQMLTLAGLPDAGARAERIVALETAMAKVHWSPTQQRDLDAMLKPMDAAGRAKAGARIRLAADAQDRGL